MILSTYVNEIDRTDNIMKKQAVIHVQALGFQWQTSDPFLFCAYHEDFFPAGNEQMGPKDSLQGRNIGQDFTVKDGWRMYHGDKVPGFPAHPHRGFETVTVVTKGIVDHADSLGAAGRYGNGDTQWLTSGKGVQHSEMFPLLNQDKDNSFELFQIWLNLPQANKMVDPYFTMLWQESIPTHVERDSDGRKTEIDIIAGAHADSQPLPPPPNSWAADPDNHVAIWTIKMEPGAKWSLSAIQAGINRTLFFYRGSTMDIAGNSIEAKHGVELHSDIEVLLENANEDAYLLLLQGRPINEPVAHYGPFVMNTRDELQQAFIDYQETQFGGWPWPDHDQVFPRTRGRFARHADGSEEEKGNW